MAYQELFAKRTFAQEAALVTGGAAIWQDPPEIQLETVRSDGYLVIHTPHLLAPLAAPWPEARAHEEVMVERRTCRSGSRRRASPCASRPAATA
jgi:hypothetical protein